MWRRLLVVCIGLPVLWVVPAPVGACERDCDGNVRCELRVAACLLDEDRARDAIYRLKKQLRIREHVPALSRMLARAYTLDNNPFWAQRALRAAIERDARDCESRSWLAWLHIGQGDFDLATQELDAPGCPQRAPDKARWLLLRAYLARARNAPGALDLVTDVPDVGTLYPEDESLWLFLRRAEDPGWLEPIDLRVELSAGYTSNARAGSPTDPSTQGEGSLLARLDVWGRFAWPLEGSVRPSVEVGLKGHGLSSKPDQELSFLEMSARPGVILGRGSTRVLLGYHVDYLVLNRDLEKRRRFYEGHRAEVELETGALTLFAGTGRRFFHESGRTRWEFDGGAGGSFRLFGVVHALAAGSLRYYDAFGDPYDQLGGTALLVFRFPIGAGFSARLGATLGLDSYLHSGGDLGDAAYRTRDKRHDLLTKLSAGVWMPPNVGFRFGITYEFSMRDSSIDSGNSSHNYDFSEHRLLVRARWTFDLNPWAPGTVVPKEHVPLEYGVAEPDKADLEEERIQDLLRQDESARRGSSCIN